NDKPGPRQLPRDTTKKDSTAAKGKSAPKPPAPKKPAKDTAMVDLTVEVVDANNTVARVPLSKFGMPRRPLETHVYRRESREKQAFTNNFEIVLQTYVLPFAEFTRASPTFAPDKIRSIRLVFDRLAAGTVIVDDVGVSAI